VIPGADVASVTVPLRSRRRKRVQLVQKIQHVIPAFGLLVLNFLDLENAADVRAALEKAQQRLIPEEQQ